MQISAVRVHPIKSLGGFDVDSAIVEEKGLRHDRRWMLVGTDGEFVTQRDEPLMAGLHVEDRGDHFAVLSRTGAGPLLVSKGQGGGKEMEVSVWDSKCMAVRVGDDASAWFEKELGAKRHLVFMPEGSRREISNRYAIRGEAVSFADGYPLLLCGEASLEELNSRMSRPVPMGSFRPNLVISGAEPFAEDQWKRIRVGNSLFRVVKPCARCVVTTTDQRDGSRRGKEPLKTLSAFRRASDVLPGKYGSHGFGKNDVLFGQNLIPLDPGGRVSVGDEVNVLDRN